jgi:membrane-associated phospholipid phosphatase
VRKTPQSYRLGVPVILLAALVMAACTPAKAQVSTSEGSASLDSANADDSVNTAPLTSGDGATSSISQTDTQVHVNIGPSVSRAAGARCDLVSALLTCMGDMFRDQAGIWSAPARLRGPKLLWLAPFATATALAFEYDVRAMNALGPSPTRIRVSNDFTHLGSGYLLIPAAGLTYLVGKLDRKEGPREAGALALESIADTTAVVEVLKLATDRQRPYVPPGTGRFWPADVYTLDSSFPSGHSAATWAIARVMVEETPGHPWLHALFYSLAAGVSIGRVTGENHFPSDALVGSVIGYSIGGYVYHHHSAFYTPKTKALTIEPLYNPATASYGVSLAIRP